MPTNIANKMDKEVGAKTEEEEKEAEEVEEKITEKPNLIREITPTLRISKVQVRIIILVCSLVRKI